MLTTFTILSAYAILRHLAVLPALLVFTAVTVLSVYAVLMHVGVLPALVVLTTVTILSTTLVRVIDQFLTPWLYSQRSTSQRLRCPVACSSTSCLGCTHSGPILSAYDVLGHVAVILALVVLTAVTILSAYVVLRHILVPTALVVLTAITVLSA